MPENSRAMVNASSGYQIPFDIYRPGQGMYARGVTAISLCVTILFGCIKVYNDYGDKVIFDSEIPILGIKITWGLLGALILFIASLVGIMYVAYVNKKCVDFLIETETELRKVNWPVDKQATGFFEKYQELFNSAGVVITCTIVLGIFIFFVDVIVEHTMRWLGVL